MAYPSDLTGYWWVPSKLAENCTTYSTVTLNGVAEMYRNHSTFLATMNKYVTNNDRSGSNWGITDGTSVYNGTYSVSISTSDDDETFVRDNNTLIEDFAGKYSFKFLQNTSEEFRYGASLVGILFRIPELKSTITKDESVISQSYTSYSCTLYVGLSTSGIKEPRDWSGTGQLGGTNYIWIKAVSANSDFVSYGPFYTGLTCDVTGAPHEYDLTQETPSPSNLSAGDMLICPYSGAIHSCILPPGIYKLETWGARGGNRDTYSSNKYGKGGYCTGKLTVSQQTTYYCVTGGAGAQNAAGYNGGGAPGGTSGCGGGGASHISTVSSLLAERSGDYTRTVPIVAGGGGGTSHSNCTYGNNGDGGGLTGISGASYSSSYTVATGGTQSGGGTGGEGHNTTGYSGSFGRGGNGNSGSNFAGSGGGGGLYGGGGGGGSDRQFYNRTAGGAGGSSYYNTSLLTEYSTIAGNADMPSSSGGTETGHNDNGYIKITIIEITPTCPFFVNINGTWKQCTNAYVNVNGTWKEVTDVKTNVSGTWK